MPSDLDLLLRADWENARPTKLDRALFFVNGLLVSLIPAFIFHGIFDYEAESHVAVYAVTSLLSAIVLSFAFLNFAVYNKRQLVLRRDSHITSRDGTKAEIAAKRAEQQRLTTAESRLYAIFTVNASFVAASVFLAFFLRYQPAASFVLSQLLPAVGLAFTSALL
eukprot:m51a1_g5385 putative translocon-associated protein trap gamma subunit (165) ;mRNA; r:15081-15879